MKKRLLSAVLSSVMVFSLVYYSPALPAFAQQEKGECSTASPSDAERQEPDDEGEDEYGEGEADNEEELDYEQELDNDLDQEFVNTATKSDAEFEEDTELERVEMDLLSLEDADEVEMFAFNSSTGTITGFSNAYLNQMERGDDGILHIDLAIPAEINGAEVKAIGKQAFDGRAYSASDGLQIDRIDLSQAANLETIDEMAFDAYSAPAGFYSEMEECPLILPDGLVTIGGNAFRKQENLTGDLILPDSLESIGESTFEDCGFDGRLKLPENKKYTTVKKQSFNRCGFSGILMIPENISILEGNYAFSDSKFESVIFNNNIATIGGSTFKDCSALAKVTVAGKPEVDGVIVLPDGLTTMGNFIFHNCTNLEGTIKIPDSVTKIGSECFENTKIHTIYGPNNEDTVYSDNLLTSTNVNVFVLPTKALFDKVTSVITNSGKALCGYPITLTFKDESGNTVDTREVLYNRPVNYKMDDVTLGWGADEDYQLPEWGEAQTGYDVGWSFGSNGEVITEKSIVKDTTLYHQIALSPLTVSAKDVFKVYDGKPSYLTVNGSHPITGVDTKYFIYYRLWSGNTIVHKGTSPVYYEVKNVVDSGRYPYRVDLYYNENGHGVSKLKYEYGLNVVIQKADMKGLAPIVPSSAICPAILSDVMISLPEDALPGKLEWSNPNQELVLGNNTCEWIYTPDNAENFTKASYSGSVSIMGKEAPTVERVTVLPASSELSPGETIRFSAVVEGKNDPSQEVAWSVEGGTSETIIDGSGLLKISANESADLLTVKATSQHDPGIIGSAKVVVKHQKLLTVIFDVQGGTEIEPVKGITAGSEIVLPIPQRAGGYRFDGWYTSKADGVKLGTSVKLETDLVVYAHWSQEIPPDENGDDNNNHESNGGSNNENSDDGSDAMNELPAPDFSIVQEERQTSGQVTTVTRNGEQNAVLTDHAVQQMIKAAASNSPESKQVLNLQIAAPAQNSDPVSVSLPKGISGQMAEAGVDWVQMKFGQSDLTVRMNRETAGQMEKNSSAGIRIITQKLDQTQPQALSQSNMQGKALYHLSAVYEASQKTVNQLDNSFLEIIIPYQLAEGEGMENLAVVQIHPDGTVSYVDNHWYDAAQKAVVFRINLFGTYGIVQKE